MAAAGCAGVCTACSQSTSSSTSSPSTSRQPSHPIHPFALADNVHTACSKCVCTAHTHSMRTQHAWHTPGPAFADRFSARLRQGRAPCRPRRLPQSTMHATMCACVCTRMDGMFSVPSLIDLTSFMPSAWAIEPSFTVDDGQQTFTPTLASTLSPWAVESIKPVPIFVANMLVIRRPFMYTSRRMHTCTHACMHAHAVHPCDECAQAFGTYTGTRARMQVYDQAVRAGVRAQLDEFCRLHRPAHIPLQPHAGTLTAPHAHTHACMHARRCMHVRMGASINACTRAHTCACMDTFTHMFTCMAYIWHTPMVCRSH